MKAMKIVGAVVLGAAIMAIIAVKVACIVTSKTPGELSDELEALREDLE